MTNTAVLLPLLQTGVRPGLSKGVLTREQVAAMSDEAFRSLCRRYQAAFKELVPIVDAEGCRDAEGRVVSSTYCGAWLRRYKLCLLCCSPASIMMRAVLLRMQRQDESARTVMFLYWWAVKMCGMLVGRMLKR